MKRAIFCLLFSLILNAYFLPKYKSIKLDIKSGIVYLNATEFDFNKNIHIQISSYNSYIYRKIHYDFSDDENFLTPSKEVEPASSFSSSVSASDEKISFTKDYYYEILKDSSKKYLFLNFLDIKRLRMMVIWKLKVLELIGVNYGLFSYSWYFITIFNNFWMHYIS